MYIYSLKKCILISYQNRTRREISLHLVTRGFLFASILRGIRMAPAAEGSRKRKSALSYDLRNPRLLPLLAVKELFLIHARVDRPIAVTLTADAF